MRFTSVVLAASTFVGAWAKPEFTNPAFGTLTAGQVFTLTWSNAVGPVDITLKKGNPGNLQTVSSVGSGLTGTSFAWTPSVSLADGTYALEIDDSTGPNFSPQFELTGGAGVTGTSVGSASASASASGSTASTGSSVSISASASGSTASGSTASSVPPLTTSTESKTTSTEKTTSTPTLTSSAKPTVQNTTSTSASSTSSVASSTSSSATGTSTSPPDNNSAAGLASPLAFVFLAFAAILTLN